MAMVRYGTIAAWANRLQVSAALLEQVLVNFRPIRATHSRQESVVNIYSEAQVRRALDGEPDNSKPETRDLPMMKTDAEGFLYKEEGNT